MTAFDRNRAMSAFAQELDANQPQDDEVAMISTNNADDCCENAREMYFQHLDERIDTEDFSGTHPPLEHKEWFKEYIRDPRSGSPALRDCEGLRQHLENLVARRGPNSDKVQQILDEWDACADAKISSNSNILFDKAWKVVKAPLWTDEGTTADYEPEVVYPFENGGFSLVPEINDAEIAEYRHHASLPRFWESKNKDARAVAVLAEGEVDDDPKDDYHQIRMFEMARDARGKGLARDRLREMIAELREHDPTATSTHVTHSERDTADFWDKLVDEGLIDSASTKPYVTTTPDGKLIPKTRLSWFFDRRVK